MGTLWQRNYWEHIVRDKNELGRIRDYIRNNPQKWETDKLNGGSGNIVMETQVEYGVELWMVYIAKTGNKNAGVYRKTNVIIQSSEVVQLNEPVNIFDDRK